MIVYIASYPRSGNSLTQNTLEAFFERPLTVVYGGSHKADHYAAGGAKFVKNWRAPSARPRLQRLVDLLRHRVTGDPLARWSVRYDLAVPPYTRNCRYLLPGCLDILTPTVRRRLANEESVHFIKTHEPPYEDYYAGEHVVLAVRHPALVFLSYREFVRSFHKLECTLDQVIEGDVPFGSWAAWHAPWSHASLDFSRQFLISRFEDVLRSPLDFCSRVASLTGLEFNPNRSRASFEELHARAPDHIRSGKVDGWHAEYTRAQLARIAELHGGVISRFGLSDT
jgi:hypothetical protein